MVTKTETKHICYKETEIALINNNMEYMKKEMGEIKHILTDFIDSANSKFATKEDHKDNKLEIENVKKELKIIQLQNAKWIGMASIIVGIISILINKFL